MRKGCLCRMKLTQYFLEIKIRLETYLYHLKLMFQTRSNSNQHLSANLNTQEEYQCLYNLKHNLFLWILIKIVKELHRILEHQVQVNKILLSKTTSKTKVYFQMQILLNPLLHIRWLILTQIMLHKATVLLIPFRLSSLIARTHITTCIKSMEDIHRYRNQIRDRFHSVTIKDHLH